MGATAARSTLFENAISKSVFDVECNEKVPGYGWFWLNLPGQRVDFAPGPR